MAFCMTPFGIFIGEALKNQDTHTTRKKKKHGKENEWKEKTSTRRKCYYI